MNNDIENNTMLLYTLLFLYWMMKLYSSSLYKVIKRRDAFYKNKEWFAILVYFVVLFAFDFSGMMDLYGQNFVRRLMNMYRRTDSLTYSKKLQPFCEPVKKMLNEDDIAKLQSIQIPDSNDLSVFTRKNTTTHQCCEKYSEQEKKIISDISEKVRQAYEKEIGQPLYNLHSNKATIYVYHGKFAQHLWHVDPQNLKEIYNVIICIKKKGKISPLQCKQKDSSSITSIHFEEGDAALFNGGTTVHQVPPNEDDNSERTVLSIAFTTDVRLNEDEKYSNNMCTFTEGGNNYFNMMKIVMGIFLLNFFISFVSGVDNVSYKWLFLLVLIILPIVKYVPLYADIGIGSGRSSSIGNNLCILLALMLLTLSTKGAILFFAYFVLSDVFFASSWVAYD